MSQCSTVLFAAMLGLATAFDTSWPVAALTNDTSVMRVADDTARLPLNEQQIADLNSQLVQARGLTAEAKVRLDRLNELLGDAKDFDPADSSFPALVEALNDPQIEKLRQQYVDYAARVEEYSRRYGANHLVVINLRILVDQIHESIRSELAHVAGDYDIIYKMAKAHEETIEKSLADALQLAR
jgi:polysaccharide biosynthesis transport protein